MRTSVALLLLASLVHTPSAAPSWTGPAPHYAPGVMEAVAAYRGYTPGPCDISSPWGLAIGTRVVITSDNPRRTVDRLVCRVMDVSAPRDEARHRRRGYAAELGFPAARQLCGVRWYGDGAPRECVVTVTVLE